MKPEPCRPPSGVCVSIVRPSAEDAADVASLDSHIPLNRLADCLRQGFCLALREDSGNGRPHRTVGILRYSLFWQTIPFLDLLLLEEAYRRRGFGRAMMAEWEADLHRQGYAYAMTSTQADEDAFRFYEKLGYRKVGGFFPPGQEAEELFYLKNLREGTD